MRRHHPTLNRQLGLLLAFLAALLAAGIAVPASVATPPGSFAVPDLRVAPPVLHFGSIGQGETRERTVSVKNTGSEPAQINRIGVSMGFPIFSPDFSTLLETCPLTGGGAPVLLPPGETCTVTVIARADASTVPGTYEGLFVMGTLTQDSVVVPLSVKVR